MNTDEKGSMIGVDEVCKRLKVSRSYAYRVIRRLNNDLKERGFSPYPER